jgi:hypothetical protein
MEPEGSLSCSQEPSIGPYPEPNQWSPHQPILRSILILSSHLRLGLLNGLFPSGFPSLQPPDHPCSSPADSSTLKMEVIRSSETSVHTRCTQRHSPEDGILHSHRCENLKSYTGITCSLFTLWSGKRKLNIFKVFDDSVTTEDWKTMVWFRRRTISPHHI